MGRTRKRAGLRARWSDDDREITRAIDREHAVTWKAMEESGHSSPIDRYPAVRRLLEAVEAADQCGRLTNGRFSYCGRSYRVRREGLGRLVVYHPSTGNPIGSTSFFSA